MRFGACRIAVTVAFLVSACGGGGSPTTPSPTTPSPPKTRTDTFPFTLDASNLFDEAHLGPVQVATGNLTVTLTYSGPYVILACVGTTEVCGPLGGVSPTTVTIPIGPSGDFPAGPIVAGVYFKIDVKPPTGVSNGTLTLTYTPQ